MECVQKCQGDQIVTKVERLAELLYKMYGTEDGVTASYEDRREIERLVVCCDGPTYQQAKELAQQMRQVDTGRWPFAPAVPAAA